MDILVCSPYYPSKIHVQEPMGKKNTELMIMMLQHWGEISGRWGKVTLFDMNWVKISKSRSEKVSI
jgi:hypothetical protein